MRHPTVPFLLGLVLAAAAACADSASRLAAPDNSASLGPSGGPSLTQGSSGNNGNNGNNGGNNGDNSGGNNGNYNNDEDNGDREWDKRKDDDEVDVCHAYGKDEKRYGKNKYLEIKTTKKYSSSHLDKHGKPKNGHDEDYVEPKGERGCTGTSTVSKTLVDVMTTDSKGKMISDPTWTPGGPVTIPKGETRWLFYRIDYALPGGGYGTLSEDKNSVCGTLGSGFYCSFNTGGKYSWSVKGSASKEVQIDITNNSRCDSQDFTNTAVLTPKSGKSVSASAKVTLKLTCGTGIKFTKKLLTVMSWGTVGMIKDPAWDDRTTLVTVPQGDTRWIDYLIEYTLPAGVTGTISENQTAVCATTGPVVQCSAGFASSNPWVPLGNNVFGVQVSGSGSVVAQYDITNPTPGVCNETRTFINTATFTPTGGGTPITVSSPITIRYTCEGAGTLTKTLHSVMKWGPNGSMVEDLARSPEGDIIVPQGDTRWIDYQITYTLPAGTTGTVIENQTAVCATTGPVVQCSAGFATSNPWVPLSPGVFGVPNLSGTGSVIAQYDITNPTPGVCNERRQFTNTATLRRSGAIDVVVSSPIWIKYTC
jgi:hypothetical protein